MSYYHYTKGSHLPKIVKDGIIKTTNNGCEKREKPAAWLTKSSEWEVACNVGIVDSEGLEVGKTYSAKDVEIKTADNEYMKQVIGMCRIVISETLPTISWAKFKYVSGISDRMYNALDEGCRSKGSPTEKWSCTFSPVPKRYWESIEMYVVDQWVSWDEKIPIEEFVELCLNCNGKLDKSINPEKLAVKDHYQNESNFMKEHHNEIVELWEANKHQRGYIEIHVNSKYKTNKADFRYVKKPFKKSDFNFSGKSITNTYALVRFLWEATNTQYSLTIPYNNALVFQQYQNEANFMTKYKNEISTFWEANKHKKGYMEVYVTPDYEPTQFGFRFIEKRVNKSDFMRGLISNTDTYALVHFLWMKTYTQYKVAFAYEQVKDANYKKSVQQ
jgi:hypothetical protein